MIKTRPKLRVIVTKCVEMEDGNGSCLGNSASPGSASGSGSGSVSGRGPCPVMMGTVSENGAGTIASSLHAGGNILGDNRGGKSGGQCPSILSTSASFHHPTSLLTLDWNAEAAGSRCRIDTMLMDDISPVSPSRHYHQRLILPLGTKEIEFTVPQTLSPLTPTFGRKGLNSGESSPGSLSGSRSETEASTSRANTPSPIFFRGNGSELSSCTMGGSLGGLNPELYKSRPETEEEEGVEYPEIHFGRVWYALEYETTSERLLVTLIKARNLAGRRSQSSGQSSSMSTSTSTAPSASASTLGSAASSFQFSSATTSTSLPVSYNCSCNPFVRVSLFPDERRTLQSKPKKMTRHPQFDETFGFQISKAGLAERSLKLCFYDIDESKKYQMLGYIIQPLKDIDWSFGKQVFKEDLLRDSGELSPNIGEVLVSLCYNGNISRLTVNIIEAKGIKSRESASGLYAKISLIQHTKIVKTKKTSSVGLLGCRSSFNESFNFKLPADMLDTASVSIQLMYAQPGYNKDQTAGRIVLGSFMFARGKGLDHWTEMLSKQKEQIQYWHAISE